MSRKGPYGRTMVPGKKFLTVIFLFVLMATVSGCAGLSKRTLVSPKEEVYLKDLCAVKVVKV